MATRTPLRLFQRSSCLGSSASRFCLPTWQRSYSTDGPSQDRFEAIRDEMLARPTQSTWDVTSPTNSTMLNIALADFIPDECQPPGYQIAGRHIENVSPISRLPQGHHLVYFPLQKTPSELCPDGTDPFHSPGDPFVRRMWAGGSIDFDGFFRLNSTSAVCMERIEDVTVRGPEGQEKLFVNVLREYLIKADIKDGEDPTSRIKEQRSLVFMRGLSKEQARENLAKSLEGRERIVKAPNAPDFSITLTPTPTLLFQYSALTFNAHSIHLDAEYCREVEGHRNLLVHGPLSLNLMLSALRPHMKKLEEVHKIDYRNLAPLYANEPLRVCVRAVEGELLEEDKRTWEVWVEDRDGGLSVRGTAITGPRRFGNLLKSQKDFKGKRKTTSTIVT
ncbi:hypothetical protein F4781DRAFT_428847 [Annulohypoxylon bovei var. microspora]|nr:hypothetical protein F4781DRAFT_428847 [Annulohypoxylon bovei var. microspora]